MTIRIAKNPNQPSFLRFQGSEVTIVYGATDPTPLLEILQETVLSKEENA